jgi:NAD(P)H-hydrate epimerase
MEPLAGWWNAGDGVLLTPAAMAEVDRETIAGGVSGPTLMEAAGRAVLRALVARFPPQPVLVLCGPGNNGGDGYVAARRLAAVGWTVRLASLVDPAALRGDAAWARSTWTGPVEPLDPALLETPALVVDALFGAGLARDLDGLALATVERLNTLRRTVVAVDVPSGVDGTTGAVRGAAPEAALTVTFCRAKPGHLLLPGRLHAGEVVVADIGIPDAVVRAHDSGLRATAPQRWSGRLPERRPESHKYHFGHAVVVGGPARSTGAARLSALAALRVGAGLVSIACPAEALPIYAARTSALMTKPVDADADWQALIADERLNAFLIGPGAGVGESTMSRVLAILRTRRAAVLDADALTSFATSREALLGALHDGVVLTPHDGEYRRLFSHAGSRLERARAAAAESGAIVLLKGADTVVAAPDGRASIQPAAPPSLATAGAGDVLAGLIVGLLAQAMPAYEAACAGVWIHAAAAAHYCGPLVADDLPEAVPAVIRDLFHTAGVHLSPH